MELTYKYTCKNLAEICSTGRFPRNGRARTGLWFLKGEYAFSNDSIAYYKKAIRLKPDYGKAYYYLGNLFYEKKNYKLAIEEFEKTREIFQEHRKLVNLKEIKHLIEKSQNSLILLPKLEEFDKAYHLCLMKKNLNDLKDCIKIIYLAFDELKKSYDKILLPDYLNRILIHRASFPYYFCRILNSSCSTLISVRFTFISSI